MMKRVLSLFLAMVMVFGMLPVGAFAAETDPADVSEHIHETVEQATEAAEETEAPAEETELSVEEISIQEAVSEEKAMGQAGLPFSVETDGNPATVTEAGTLECGNCGEMDKWTIDVTGKEELSFTFGGENPDFSSVTLMSPDMDWDGYEEYEDHFPENGVVTLSLPADCSYVCVWDDASGASYHFVLTDSSPKFTAFVNGVEIQPEDLEAIGGKPAYLLTVPAGTTAVDFTFKGEKDYHFYNEQGVFLGTGETASSTEYTIPVRDAFMIGTSGYGQAGSDGVLDGISVQKGGTFSAEYYIMFAYAAAEEPEVEDPFLSIKIGDEEVAEENIAYKGIFQLGDTAENDNGDNDGWDYVHEVPYYHVTVPCGTASVDVTYGADVNILSSGSDAYGYRTDLEVDAVSSPTVKSATFRNAYTENADGTQTVKTPVTGYTFDAEGNGHAITLEEDGGSYSAICLFSFGYDGVNHIYDESGLCSCGQVDPSHAAPGGAEIPAGAPFTAVTTDAGDATGFEDRGTVDYTGWDTYAGVPYYHVTIPAGATKVYVTHPSSEDPFADSSYGSAYGYVAETDGWTGSGTSFAFEEADDGYIITLPLSVMVDTDNDWSPDTEGSFVEDEDGNVAYAVAVERNDFSPICFFTFKYGESGSEVHTHSYTEEVTTQPGCMTKGVRTFTCSGCAEGTEGHSYTEEIPAAGHSYDAGVETTPATCVADGVKTFTCPNCDGNTEGHTKTEKITKLGHKYDDGVVTTEPTCMDAGVKTYTCSRCAEGTEGHTRTEAVSATGHDYQNGKCENCGDVCPQQDENGVFQIGTYEELLWFAEEVNDGNTAIKGALTADITLPENWPGIGNSTNKFAGTLDGQNHTVTLSGSTWGLFGYVMGTWNSSFSGKEYVVVQNVITEGTARLTPLIHRAGYARIRNCINRADVDSGSGAVAGIVGDLNYALQYNSIKWTDVLIENCANEGDIHSSASNIGGILGEGLAGVRINGCSNTGNISGASSVGGLVGYMQESKGTCEIRNSYNKGTVTGGSYTGGIIGNQYNGVSVINCYNAGEAGYAIAGRVYNKTATASNVYYRTDLSDCGEPEYFIGSNSSAAGFNTTVRGAGKSSAEMGTAAFAALLGDAFQESCGGPVLTWQTAKEHNLIDGICYDCKAYHEHESVKAKYNVHKGTGGYEIVGDTEVTAGSSYTFTVRILDGYYEENLTVYVNGAAVTANAEGGYTVTPTGHFYITVTGVKELEGVVPVSLPGAGSGYRVVPCDGYSTTVESGKDFKFTVSFVNGFKAGKNFAVKANGVKVTPDADGVYTIENVIIKQTITVEGVDIIPVDPVTVKIAVTMGETDFLVMEETGAIMMEQEMNVPYFDLELYGLDHVYYNPYCYLDEQGNIRSQQKAGNKETAYGVVTTLHALIYATELYYLGYDEDVIGTGYSHTLDQDGDGKSDFQEALNVTANAGSTFAYMWGDGGNLNYHLNYTYPLAYPEWGSTSDQQALKDGDVISIHFITGSASSSAFGFFAVNDENNTYDKTEQLDRATVHQGESIKLTHYVASQGEKYSSRFDPAANKALYWVEQGNESSNVEVGDEEEGTNGSWHRDGFGSLTAEAFKTDANGEIVIDTTHVEPGTYYIAAQGGFTAGDGKPGSDGFVSRGAEAGPAYFVLTVEETLHRHDYTSVVTAPTCTEGGYTTYTCACEHSYIADETAPLGHSFADVDGKILCANCGEELSLSIAQEYLALTVGQTVELAVSPAEFAGKIEWSVDGDEGIITMDGSVITAAAPGTAYITAAVAEDGFESVVRFRVDVAEEITIDGVQLASNKATTELYKTEYTTFEILLQLPQNYTVQADETQTFENKGIAIEGAKFTDETMAKLFDLVVLDDRTVQIVPTNEAVNAPKTVKGSYKGTVTVTVAGQDYETETMTLSVKKSTPKLKATIAAFNSYYAGQSQEIVVTGGTVTEIRENAAKNTAKATAIPAWVTLADGVLTLNENAPAKNVSGNAYIEVLTAEWRIPAALTLSVKNNYKVPGLKLAANSVTVSRQPGAASVQLQLVPTNKTDTISGIGITVITAPEGYTVENFNEADGTFTLTAPEGFTAGKVELTVTFGTVTTTLKLTVKTENVKLKLSASKVTLNKTLGDTASVSVTWTTKGFDVTAPVLTFDAEKLDVRYANGKLTVALKEAAEYGKTYPVTISAHEGASAVKLNVAVLKANAVVKSTIKATGTLDVIRSSTAITVTPTYTNVLNVDVDNAAVLKIYSSADKYAAAIAEVKAVNGSFAIDNTIISDQSLKYKAQLETVIGGQTVKSSQINLNVKMGSAKLTVKSANTTLFAKDCNDRALFWFESTDAAQNAVTKVEFKNAKQAALFRLIDNGDGSWSIAFKDGNVDKSLIGKSVTVSLNVFIQGNMTAKANASVNVKLTIVK